MPGFVLHAGASVSCPHGGLVSVIPSGVRVLVGGAPVATALDQWLVAGCAYVVAGVPHPCVLVRWSTPATKVLDEVKPPVLLTSLGLCLAADQTPQGPATVTASQVRVSAL